MLISNVASREMCTEVTIETLTAFVCATVRDWHCCRCDEINRHDGFDDAVVAVSLEFVVCRLKMDVYLEMVLAGGMTLRSAFDTHVKLAPPHYVLNEGGCGVVWACDSCLSASLGFI
jgi:hypothetical protein